VAVEEITVAYGLMTISNDPFGARNAKFGTEIDYRHTYTSSVEM
jgi:hypothetical protein